MESKNLSPYQRKLFVFLGMATLFEGFDFFALTQLLPELGQDFGKKLCSVSETHQAIFALEEGVLDSGVTGRKASLHHQDGAGLEGVENGHTGDGARGVFNRRGVHDVVGPDDHGDIGVAESPLMRSISNSCS